MVKGVFGLFASSDDQSSYDIQKSESEWREELTPEQYQVLRQKGTERPFTGKYWNTKEKGMFMCAACGQELFESGTKFDSGTGWPSFTEAKDGAVTLKKDTSHGMIRTEVLCSKCGSHLGHVFDDGPQDKGGKRHCINSCALELKAGS